MSRISSQCKNDKNKLGMVILWRILSVIVMKVLKTN